MVGAFWLWAFSRIFTEYFLLMCSISGHLVHLASALMNPILPGWNPDPSIVRVGSDYFIVTSSFEYFPGHPIYHSTDLVNWKLIGHGLNKPSQLSLFGTPSDAGAWGAGLRYHNGTFYLTSTVRYVYTCKTDYFSLQTFFSVLTPFQMS